MIRLVKPYIEFAEVEPYFREIFASGILTKGQFVDRFVQEIKDYTGAKHAFLATSATTALTMCLKLLEIGPGDEVVVSDFSFPASANVIEDVGAVPVFADVDADTYNVTPEELERKITVKTKAVIFVDALGNPTGLNAIAAVCRRRGIPLIEDAACAIGSSEGGKKCGNVADLTCFSFHPRKLLTTGEGGAITTNNDDFAAALRIKLNHGAEARDGALDFVSFGYNYRLPELQSVMGIVQLKKLDAIVADRIGIRRACDSLLAPLGFSPQRTGPGVVHNIQSLVYKVPAGVDRDDLGRHLKAAGVESTIGTYCLSGTTYYRSRYGKVQPTSSFLEKNTITLPCFAAVDYEYICEHIAKFMK